MQEMIESKNNFFFPQILPLEKQKERLKCPNNNIGNTLCISQCCQLPGIICRQKECQCQNMHQNCQYIKLKTLLENIDKNRKQVTQEVKQTYQTIYGIINEMIQNLSLLREKFQRQQHYFALSKKEVIFYDLIYQNKIDQINGKMINNLRKSLNSQRKLNLSSKQEILMDFECKKQKFNDLCNYIQKYYSQINQNFQNFSFLKNKKIFEDSKIVKNNLQKYILKKWLQQSFQNKPINSKLLFRASLYKFDCKKFHQFCDGKKDTLVIVKNEYDKVIGGFTPIQWQSIQKKSYDKTDRSFLFSLNLKQKYKYMNKNNISLYSSSQFGPVFGMHSQSFVNDLAIYDKCNIQKNSKGNIGHTYNFVEQNKMKYKFDNQQTFTQFTGNTSGNNFLVIEYEVYQIQSV